MTIKAFVAGATGRTGKQIVEVLTEKEIPVVALVRSLEKGKQLLPSSVELVVGDVLRPETWEKAIASCNVLLCATGATPSLDFTQPYRVDYEGTKNLITVAERQKLDHFVLVSSLCVSQFFHPLNLFWLVLYWKKLAEEALQQSQIPYTIVRPGGLLDYDTSESLIMETADTLFEGRIPRRKVAEVAVEALFSEKARQKIVEIITQADAPAQNWEQLFSRVV
ncbi:SDR family oxidoreductase [Spirulina subsalsa FACHB-351]|uniref:SDR family oxidoreductase n=1 Tax=Spirulina subsalsa FACHB-351 TaxID=234711 RepID=A0ABT3L9X7_9CYAN|nr:SDR family oxidoreductase [Spirulina subsalsa]MCW6038318.1 SDR family oxidoreductase [Spirulina subsalsa FACHB-351]